MRRKRRKRGRKKCMERKKKKGKDSKEKYRPPPSHPAQVHWTSSLNYWIPFSPHPNK